MSAGGYNVEDHWGKGIQGGGALGGAQKKLSGKAFQTGWNQMVGDTGHGPNSPGPSTTDPLQGHIDSQPLFEQGMYGSGGYDPDKFKYEHKAYDIGAITGYDTQGYDVAQRGGLQGYDPTEVQAMDFDPYRRNKLQDVSATSASGQASAEGALARTGGMSASDRMAMASQFNRDKIAGRSQALGQTDELESENRFQTQMENARSQTGADRYMAGQVNQASMIDQGLLTDASRYGSDAKNTAAQELNAAKNLARIGNVDARNIYESNEASRRYAEGQDLYGGKTDEWMTKGKLMSGNPGEGPYDPIVWDNKNTNSLR